MKNIIKKIEKLKSFLPLDQVMTKSLKDFLDVKYNYNTNAIEWTTLTEKETSLVLRWETIPKHSLIEHFEVINHRNAFNFIYNITNWFLDSNKTFDEIFTKENLLKIHKMLLTNINNDFAWIYRRQNVRIAFSRAVLPRHEKVDTMISDFFTNSIKSYKELNLNNLEEVLKFWYDIHLNFVKIHPFVDWNGRTARLLMNLWFLYAINNLNIVYFSNRQEYVDSIESSEKNIKNYYSFMNKNFAEIKTEELDLIKNKIIYKF